MVMHADAHTSVNQVVQALFQGKLFQSPVAVGACLFGWAPQTSYAHVSRGTFPIGLTDICGKKMVSLADLIQFLIEGKVTFNPPVEQFKRGVGRPTRRSTALTKGGAV